ncbi:MAG: HNH endonuclease [Bacteroidetes Order II. Incertae sedis bacterium]|jgi:5-methylcytosine-specific restriction endonuclease McrA|nr:HNH endonuclease [Bacteroidetes Order II. bacterium]
MIGLRTLVLNADMTPIDLLPRPESIPAEDAVTRIVNGTCSVVEEYDRVIQSPNIQMAWPAVIMRTQYSHIPRAIGMTNEYLYYRDHGLCSYCERELTIHSTTIDHVKPRSKGGLNIWTNVVAACGRCNGAKASHDPKGAWKPKNKPYEPSYWRLLDLRRKYPVKVDHESWIPWLGDWKGEITVGIAA